MLDLKQQARNLEIKHKSEKVKLTDEEKLSIFKCIRYSYLPQEVLLKLSSENDFMLAKEFIVQGLAVKLGGTEQFGSDGLKINAVPRYVVESTNVDQNDMDVKSHGAMGAAHDTLTEGQVDGAPSTNLVGRNIFNAKRPSSGLVNNNNFTQEKY